MAPIAKVAANAIPAVRVVQVARAARIVPLALKGAVALGGIAGGYSYMRRSSEPYLARAGQQGPAALERAWSNMAVISGAAAASVMIGAAVVKPAAGIGGSLVRTGRVLAVGGVTGMVAANFAEPKDQIQVIATGTLPNNQDAIDAAVANLDRILEEEARNDQ